LCPLQCSHAYLPEKPGYEHRVDQVAELRDTKMVPCAIPGAKFAKTAELRGQVRAALHSHQELRAAPMQAPLL
jgi:hypothetical protein